MIVIIKLYTDHNSLQKAIKKLSLSEPLLFQSQTTWSTTTLSSIKPILDSLQNGVLSLSQPYLSIQPALLSPPKTVSLLQSIFTSLLHPYLFKKSSLKSLLTSPSAIPQQIFTSLFLRLAIPTIYIKNIFPTSTISPIQAKQEAREVCEK